MTPLGPPNSRELGFYLALAQVGVEMVVPAGIGAILDAYLGWGPWGVIVGAVLGLILGFTHLIRLLQRHDKQGSSEDKRDAP